MNAPSRTPFPLLALASLALAPSLMAIEPHSDAVDAESAPKHEASVCAVDTPSSSAQGLSTMEDVLQQFARGMVELTLNFITQSAAHFVPKDAEVVVQGTEQAGNPTEPVLYDWPEFQLEAQPDTPPSEPVVYNWPEFQLEAQPDTQAESFPTFGWLAQ